MISGDVLDPRFRRSSTLFNLGSSHKFGNLSRNAAKEAFTDIWRRGPRLWAEPLAERYGAHPPITRLTWQSSTGVHRGRNGVQGLDGDVDQGLTQALK
jgi:hypothetical protein